MNKMLFKSGFTLIELLVVIAIIGILTSIITANFSISKAKSRDAKRVADIANIQLNLELLFDKCNAYPSSLSLTETPCPNYSLGTFTSTIPIAYGYVSTGFDYVLRATLETNHSILTDAVTSPTVTITDGCAHSQAPYYYCVQPK